MSTFSLIILFSVLSGVLSLIGGVVLLGRHEWVKKFSIHFVSFAAGTLLAVAFLDLIPEAFEMAGEADALSFYILGGIVLFFIAEKVIHRIHSHNYEDTPEHPHAAPILLTAGDAIHNFVDGAILAGAFLVSVPLGIVTALSIAAHELPQEISDFSIMLHHGWSRAKVLWTNLGVSLTNVLGAVLIYLARDMIEPVLPLFLAFTAGVFIYIATSDLLPEITQRQFKEKTWHILSLLLLGIASVWLLNAAFHAEHEDNGHEAENPAMIQADEDTGRE